MERHTWCASGPDCDGDRWAASYFHYLSRTATATEEFVAAAAAARDGSACALAVRRPNQRATRTDCR